MKEGLLSRTNVNNDQKQEYLAKLEVLKNEGKLAVREKVVTYSWWLKFNRDLSHISDENLLSNRGLGVERAFPSLVVLLTIAGEGQIGIMAMNRAFPEEIYPIGLTNKVKKVDGRLMTPGRFYEHDMLHTEIDIGLNYHSRDIKLFHSRFVKLVENLPEEKRKNTELAYFILTHELGRNFINFQETTTHSFYIGNILAAVFQSLMGKNALPAEFVKNREQIKIITDDFVEIFNQIRNQ